MNPRGASRRARDRVSVGRCSGERSHSRKTRQEFSVNSLHAHSTKNLARARWSLVRMRLDAWDPGTQQERRRMARQQRSDSLQPIALSNAQAASRSREWDSGKTSMGRGSSTEAVPGADRNRLRSPRDRPHPPGLRSEPNSPHSGGAGNPRRSAVAVRAAPPCALGHHSELAAADR